MVFSKNIQDNKFTDILKAYYTWVSNPKESEGEGNLFTFLADCLLLTVKNNQEYYKNLNVPKHHILFQGLLLESFTVELNNETKEKFNHLIENSIPLIKKDNNYYVFVLDNYKIEKTIEDIYYIPLIQFITFVLFYSNIVDGTYEMMDDGDIKLSETHIEHLNDIIDSKSRYDLYIDYEYEDEGEEEYSGGNKMKHIIMKRTKKQNKKTIKNKKKQKQQKKKIKKKKTLKKK